MLQKLYDSAYQFGSCKTLWQKTLKASSRAASIVSGMTLLVAGNVVAGETGEQNIQGTVFYDFNGNGARDFSEFGIGPVEVNFFDGSTTSSENTNFDGDYVAYLSPGTYTISVPESELFPGDQFTVGNGQTVELGLNESVTAADIGIATFGELEGFVFLDRNGNGEHDDDEPGLPDIRFLISGGGLQEPPPQLQDTRGLRPPAEFYGTVTTGDDGTFTTTTLVGPKEVELDEDSLPPGATVTTGNEFKLVFVNPEGEGQGEEGNSIEPLGIQLPQGLFRGTIFYDEDGDGTFDNDEDGIEGVDFTIVDSTGLTTTLTSDSFGEFQSFITAGTATVDVVTTSLPSNLVLTTDNVPQEIEILENEEVNLAAPMGYRIAPADLAVTKTAYRLNYEDEQIQISQWIPNNEFFFEIVLTNNGPVTSEFVNLTDVLPPTFVWTDTEVESTVVVPTPVNTRGSSANYNLVYTAMEPGDVTTITLTGYATQTGTLTNTVAVTSETPDDNLGNNEATAVVEIVGDIGADLSIVKTPESLQVFLGDEVTFNLFVTNNGPEAATQVEVRDIVIQDWEFVSASGTMGTVRINDELDTALEIPTLGVGESTTFTVVGRPLQLGNFDNIGAVYSLNQDLWDSNLENNVTMSTVTVLMAPADVAVTKSVEVSEIELGTDARFNITVTNNGPGTAEFVTLSDILPAGMELISAETTTGTVTSTSADAFVELDSLAPGASAVLTIVARPIAVGTYVNTASVNSESQDTDDGNNSASATVVVIDPVPEIDLAITKTATPNTVEPGGTIVYTLGVTNLGPDDATSVTVMDLVPAGLTVTNVQLSGAWDDDLVGNNLTAFLESLQADQGATITITATVPAEASGSITNTANVETIMEEENTGNNSASVTTQVAQPVEPGADLTIVKTANPDPAMVNQELTYTIVATNLGPDTATGVVMGDILPANATYLSATTDRGFVIPEAGYLVITGFDLNVGESVTVTIDVLPTEPGIITNIAGLLSGVADPNLANNITEVATAVGTMGDCADLAAHMTDARAICKYKKKKGEWKFKVQSKVEVHNRGTECAPGSTVYLYLSNDTTLDASDEFIYAKGLKPLCPGKTKKVKMKAKLRPDQDPRGKFLIAVVDGEGVVMECDEINNITFGPHPSSQF